MYCKDDLVFGFECIMHSYIAYNIVSTPRGKRLSVATVSLIQQ